MLYTYAGDNTGRTRTLEPKIVLTGADMRTILGEHSTDNAPDYIFHDFVRDAISSALRFIRDETPS